MILGVNYVKLFKNKCLMVNESRQFWAWLNIVFNLVDKKRISEVGADRACAEWLLRNGGEVTFSGETPTKDYNFIARLPVGVHKRLIAIDATEASITHHGFTHLSGCKHVERIKLSKNAYVTDKAVDKLSLVRDSLKNLEISHCEEVTDVGVKSITQLPKLSDLTLSELGVKDWSTCKKHLQDGLPNCKLNIRVSSN